MSNLYFSWITITSFSFTGANSESCCFTVVSSTSDDIIELYMSARMYENICKKGTTILSSAWACKKLKSSHFHKQVRWKNISLFSFVIPMRWQLACFYFPANLLMKFMRCVLPLIMKETTELLLQEMFQEDFCMFVTDIKSFAKETVSSKAAEFATNWHGSTDMSFVMLSFCYVF